MYLHLNFLHSQYGGTRRRRLGLPRDINYGSLWFTPPFIFKYIFQNIRVEMDFFSALFHRCAIFIQCTPYHTYIPAIGTLYNNPKQCNCCMVFGTTIYTFLFKLPIVYYIRLGKWKIRKNFPLLPITKIKHTKKVFISHSHWISYT